MQSSRPDWDDVQLNLESLWAGGPFVVPNVCPASLLGVQLMFVYAVHRW